MFTLIIEDRDGNIADEYSFEDGEFIIGRSHSSDIILPSDNVSRRHARLYTQDGRCFIEDLASSNGVFVNGQRIHRTFEVARSAQIKVGDYYLHVEGAGYADAPAPLPDVSPQPQASAADLSASYGSAPPPIVARLVGSSPSVQGQVHDVTRAVSLVGRGKDCALTVIDASISRIHAKLIRNQDGSLTVEDLRSSNGSYVNDQRIEQATFGHGDRIRFGNLEFVVELPGFGEVEKVEVSSGGRRFAIVGIGVLLLLLAAAAVTVYVFRDSLFGGDTTESAATDDESGSDEGSDDTDDAEELEARYERASEKLDLILRRAEKLAGKDKWADAKAELLKGKKLLDEVAKLDSKGELTARFETAETRLRTARADYQRLLNALADKDFKKAGRFYKLVVGDDGPFKTAAMNALRPEKDKLLSSGDALCAEKVYGKCLDYYQKAKVLDPTDAAVAKKVAEIRIKIVEDSKPPTPPAPKPE